MTASRQSGQHGEWWEGISAAEFPALAEFFAGYLHQDFKEEYQSADGAVRAFLADASPEEAAEFVEEWHRLLRMTSRADVRAISKVLVERLGSSWLPPSTEDFERFSQAIITGKKKK